VSNRLFLDASNSPRSALVSPQGVIRPRIAGAGGGGPGPEPGQLMNLINNNGQSYLFSEETVYTLLDLGDFTISCWVYPQSADLPNPTVMISAGFDAAPTADTNTHQFASNGNQFMRINDNTNQTIITWNGAVGLVEPDRLNHIIYSRIQGGTQLMFINGVQVVPGANSNANFMARLFKNRFRIGANSAGGPNQLVIGDLFIQPLFQDLTLPGVRRRFITQNRLPVFLGEEGELPNFTPRPHVFLGSSMDARNWSAGENRGDLAVPLELSGNDFTDFPIPKTRKQLHFALNTYIDCPGASISANLGAGTANGWVWDVIVDAQQSETNQHWTQNRGMGNRFGYRQTGIPFLVYNNSADFPNANIPTDTLITLHVDPGTTNSFARLNNESDRSTDNQSVNSIVNPGTVVIGHLFSTVQGVIRDFKVFNNAGTTLLHHWPIDDDVEDGGTIVDVVGGANGILVLGDGEWEDGQQ